MIIGPPGVGKHEVCIKLAKEFLEDKKLVVFVTTERSPDDIFDRLGENDNLYIVDVYSWSIWDKYTWLAGENVLFVRSPENLEEILTKIEEVIFKTRRKPIKIIFDSLSPLFLYNDKQRVVKFFQILTAKVKNEYGFILYTLQEGVHEPSLINMLLAIVDGYIQMRFLETETEIKRQLRIHHLKGVSGYSHEWKDLVVTEEGIKILGTLKV